MVYGDVSYPSDDTEVLYLSEDYTLDYSMTLEGDEDYLIILQIEYPGENVEYTGYTVTLNGESYNGFSSTESVGSLTITSNQISGETGNLLVDVSFTGLSPEACEISWRLIFTTLDEPPATPRIDDISGESRLIYVEETNDEIYCSSSSEITDLEVDQVNSKITLTVEGVEGTTGITEILVPKSFSEDPDEIKVYIDEALAQYSVTGFGDNWLIRIEYTHSQHIISVVTESETTPPPLPPPLVVYPPMVEPIEDIAIIDDYQSASGRIGINQFNQIALHASWGEGGNAAGLTLLVNGSNTVTDGNGWAFFNLTSDKVGLTKYSVENVSGEDVYGFENSIDPIPVIWDTVNITLSGRGRGDLGTSPLTVEASYVYDKEIFKGDILLNESTTQYQAGEYRYTVSSIRDQKYDVTSFISNTVSQIFDRVNVQLSVYDGRINTGEPVSIDALAFYEYDEEPFTGTLEYNSSLTSETVTSKKICVDSIADNKYGISQFTSNTVDVVWDKLTIVKHLDDTEAAENEPITIWYKIAYKYDDLVFDESKGMVYCNGQEMTWSTENQRWELDASLGEAESMEYTVTEIDDNEYGLSSIIGDDKITITKTGNQERTNYTPTLLIVIIPLVVIAALRSRGVKLSQIFKRV